MAVTPDDVRHVAQLARLALPEDRLARYVEELNGILAHMDALQAVPTAGARAAAADMPSGASLRADEPGSVALHRALADFAPAMRDGFFLVPRLATHDDAAEGA